jgi:hypothetical protein
MSDLKPWEDTPMCQRVTARMSTGTALPCRGPLIPTRAADWNHRAMADHRLVCCACGEGRVGTDSEVEQAEKAQRAWEIRQGDVPSSTANDMEDLY